MASEFRTSSPGMSGISQHEYAAILVRWRRNDVAWEVGSNLRAY